MATGRHFNQNFFTNMKQTLNNLKTLHNYSTGYAFDLFSEFRIRITTYDKPGNA